MKEDLKLPVSIGENLPIRIDMAGVSYCDGSYHIVRKRSDVSVIEYIVQGVGYLVIDGNTVKVSAGQVYFLPRGMDQEYYSSAEDPWVKIFINVEGSMTDVLVRECAVQGSYVFDGAVCKPIFDQVKELVYSKQNGINVAIKLAGLFFEVLLQLGVVWRQQAYDTDAVRMKQYLDSNTNRIVPNSELAAHIFRSQDYCVKLFGKTYQTTPYQYQLEQKMQIASRLLRGTKWSVDRIASIVGYQDAKYFSGLFKQKMGAPPRQYRQRHQREL